jgi:hypothetical protein
MIGLKPICDKVKIEWLRISNTGTAVAAGAIMLTATVGMLSSLSAFADTQTDLLHHQRTLAQLQQLHWRVSNRSVVKVA